MAEQAIAPGAAASSINLLKVLGPVHVWALGVGIVLVGEFMGWNYAVGKGGAFGALIACWVIGLLYTCVAMIDSEITSTVAAAGGQYAQAKHTIGPLMAFNVGLYLVLAYTMLEAGDVQVAGQLVQIGAGELRPWTIGPLGAFTVLSLAILAWLNYRGVFMTLTVNFVITAAAFLSIIILFIGVAALESRHGAAAQGPADRSALWLDRRDRLAAFRHLVLSRHRGHLPGGGGGALAGPRAAARHHDRHDHAADRRRAHLVCRLRPAALGICRLGCWSWRRSIDAAQDHRQPVAASSSSSSARCSRPSPRPMAASTMRRAPGSPWAATAICRSGSAPCIRDIARRSARSSS